MGRFLGRPRGAQLAASGEVRWPWVGETLAADGEMMAVDRGHPEPSAVHERASSYLPIAVPREAVSPR